MVGTVEQAAFGPKLDYIGWKGLPWDPPGPPWSLWGGDCQGPLVLMVAVVVVPSQVG